MPRGDRKSERVPAQVTVRLEDGSLGSTRNMSPDGIFLVMEERAAVGQAMRFTIEFANLGGPLFLQCTGEVVRVEDDLEGKRGYAVKIASSRLGREAPPVRGSRAVERIREDG